jgi:uncharacterized protein (TIGR02596 family)
MECEMTRKAQKHGPLGVNSGLSAFSLIELLTVVAIIGILISLTIPSLSGIMGGLKIGLAAETMAGALSTARHAAASKNRDVEVRLITMKNPELLASSNNEIRAVQLLELMESGNMKPLTKPRLLPSGVIIGSSTDMTSLSGLASANATTSDSPISGIGTAYSYKFFRFQSDGSADLNTRLSPPSGKYFLTIYDEKFQPSGSTPPPNFASLMIIPATGAFSVYRP